MYDLYRHLIFEATFRLNFDAFYFDAIQDLYLHIKPLKLYRKRTVCEFEYY